VTALAVCWENKTAEKTEALLWISTLPLELHRVSPQNILAAYPVLRRNGDGIITHFRGGEVEALEMWLETFLLDGLLSLEAFRKERRAAAYYLGSSSIRPGVQERNLFFVPLRPFSR